MTAQGNITISGIASANGKFNSLAQIVVGGSITTTGTGFGTKSIVPAHKYDNFESYANGTLGNAISGYVSDNSAIPTVQTTRKYTGTKAMKWVIPYNAAPPLVDNFYECFAQFGIRFPATTVRKFYCAFYQYFEQTNVAIANNYGDPYSAIHQDIRVYKHFRVGSGTPYDGIPQLADTQNMNDALVIEGHDYRLGAEDGTNTNSPGATGGINGGAWGLAEFFCNLGTPGNADGEFITKVNGAIKINKTGVNLLNPGSTKYFDWLYMFNGADYYWGTGYAVTTDEYFVDTTYQRCVICDNANYALSTPTKRFNQPLAHASDSWSNTQVVNTEPNWGTFTTGEIGYQHILVGTSDTSAGYQSAVAP